MRCHAIFRQLPYIYVVISFLDHNMEDFGPPSHYYQIIFFCTGIRTYLVCKSCLVSSVNKLGTIRHKLKFTLESICTAILKIVASSFIHFWNDSDFVHTTVETSRKAIQYKMYLFQYCSGAPTQKLCVNRKPNWYGLHGVTKAIQYTVNGTLLRIIMFGNPFVTYIQYCGLWLVIHLWRIKPRYSRSRRIFISAFP